jgi:ferritin-like metal-binding protein YciE
MKTGEELVLHFLKDMYYAEKAVLKLLPELVAAASSEQLKQTLQKHTEEAKAQLARRRVHVSSPACRSGDL